MRFISLSLILALSIAAPAFVHAQAPAFEAASIKPSTPASSSGPEFNFAPNGGLAIRNGDLKGILEMAFDVRDFQIAGAPDWTNAARYDIFAKSAADPGRHATPDEYRQEARRKLQTLLVDRCRLEFHRETRQLPLYHLMLAKGGPKFAEAHHDNPGGGINGRCGRLTGTNSSIASLVYMLSRELGRPVEDHTGLTARYDFQLTYAPENSCPQVAAEGAAADLPSVLVAVQEQLRLKLELTKGPVEIVVIDRIERPSNN